MNKKNRLSRFGLSLTLTLFLSLILGFLHPLETQAADPPDETTSPSPTLLTDFGQMPLYFIENQGQLDEEVAYYLQGSDKTLYFTSTGVTFALLNEGEASREPDEDRSSSGAEEERPHTKERYILKLDFMGANEVKPVGREQYETIVSYFKGTPDDWRTSLPTYAQLIYPDLWPGIDLVYYGTANELKYEFIVKPGADPNQIQLAYRGATDVTINDQGQLEIQTPAGNFHDDSPYAYQDIDGEQVPVEMQYALDNDEAESAQTYSYHFTIGEYDPTLPLVLDPVIFVYAGFIGGSDVDYGNDIAVDNSGNVYITGSTESDQGEGFPILIGPDLTFNNNSNDSDAFVAKIKSDGTGLLYAGYIGGIDDDNGEGIVVDDVGNAYIVGSTSSNENSFPVINGPDLTFNGSRDAFVAKIKSDGTGLLYAGYIGGADGDGGYDIATDNFGSTYVVGGTHSNENSFPVINGPDLTFNGYSDTFVAKIKADGTGLMYAGYIGGTDDDFGNGIAVDDTGNAYVVGDTRSDENSFPVLVGPSLTFINDDERDDAFVAKIKADGTGLIYAGYIGGRNFEDGNGIAVDDAGNAYVVGDTRSDENSFPVLVGPDLIHNGSNDAFIAKINTDGTGLIYAGYVGGSSGDGGDGIAVAHNDSVYISGYTTSNENSFPVVDGPDLTFSHNHTDSTDAFIAKIKPDGLRILYAGYIGGTGNDWSNSIAVDSSGGAYVVGVTNSFDSFPVTTGPDLTYNGGGNDAFVAKIAEDISFDLNPTILNFTAVEGGNNSPSQTFLIQNAIAAGSLNWRISSDVPWLTLNYNTPRVTPATVEVNADIVGLAVGSYTGQITVETSNGFGQSLSKTIDVNLNIGAGDAPVLQAGPTYLEFELLEGGNTAEDSITISNPGEGDLLWAATTDVSWVSVGEANGTTATELSALPVTVNSSGLSPGLYMGTVTVTSSNGQGSPQTVQIFLRVLSTTPTLETSTPQLYFFAETEKGNPAAQSIEIVNVGGGEAINWTATENISWLSLDKSSATTPDEVTASVDISGLDQGTYDGQITIAASGAAGSPKVIPVTLQLYTARQLRLSTQRLDFSFLEGDTPAPQSFEVRNFSFLGNTSFNWQAQTDVDWIKLDQTSGVAETIGAPVNVSIDGASLSPGNYMGQINIDSSEDVKATPQSVNVLMAVASKQTPKCLLTQDLSIINSTFLSLNVSIDSTVIKEPVGCDVEGRVTLEFPQNRKVIAYRGEINANNKLVASIDDQLEIGIANVKLRMSGIKLDETGLTADGTLLLSKIGGGNVNVGQVRIDRNGLSIDGKPSFNISQKVDLEGFEFSTSRMAIRTATTKRAFEIDIDGKIKLKIPGSPIDIDMKVTLSRFGVKVKTGDTLTLPDFNVKLAGLTLTVKKPKFGSFSRGRTPYIFAPEAKLKIPKSWGGLEQTVYEIKIDKNGKIEIGGGKFKLPTIKAGGFELGSLEGSLKRVSNGYEISAYGEFRLVPSSSSGCKLIVGVTLFAGVGGASVLEIDSSQVVDSAQIPLKTNVSAQGLALRQIQLGLWDCRPGIPIGISGLFLTGVKGTVTLNADIQRVNVTIQVQTSKLRVGNTAAVYSEAGATLTRYRNTKKLDLLFDGVVKVIGVEANRTTVKINENLLEAQFKFTYLIVRADVKVRVGYSKSLRKTFFNGSGSARVEVKKGAIFKEKVCFIGCLTIPFPPFTWRSPSVNADFGTFRSGAIGFKGYVSYAGFDAGFYVDTKGKVDFGKVNKYVLASSSEFAQAYQTWQAIQRGELSASTTALDNRFAFDDGLVRLNVPIPSYGPALQTASVTEDIPVPLRNDVIFLMSQPVTGTLTLTLFDPDGGIITPDQLPANIEYVESVDEEGFQSMYVVSQAMPGNWQMQVDGDTDNTFYAVSALGNEPAPKIDIAFVTPQDSNNQRNLVWGITSVNPDTTVNVYATEGPIFETITLTDTTGFSSTNTVPIYTGQPVATEITSLVDGTLQEHLVDLSNLPTGDYYLWIEVDDKINPPVQKYATEILSDIPLLISVTHNNDFPTSWTPAISVTTDIRSQSMLVEWEQNPHPDIDTYTLNLRTTDPLSPTRVMTDAITGSAATIDPVSNAILDGVEPNHTYHFEICAEDLEAERTVCSPEQIYETPQPEFLLTVSNDSVQVAAGEEVSVPIKVQMSDDLPHPVGLQPNYELLPDGFLILFEPDMISSTTNTNTEATVYILADENMLPGNYSVPIIGRSGLLERDLVLNVRVEPPKPETNLKVYLPIVRK